MAKRHYVMALGSYLAIPVVVIAGFVLTRLIDPEMAHGSADYERNFRLLQMVATGAVMAVAGLALILWASTCYLVLKARQRSVLWLALAAAGPIGFMFIAMLADRSPAADDLYQQFIRRLKLYWRIPLEVALFVSIWVLAYQCVALKRTLQIRLESYSTGTPVETIIARYDAASGMYGFGEALETMYLVTLIYLLWPLFFNLVGKLVKRRTNRIH